MAAGKLLMRAGKVAAWDPYVLPRSILKAWWSADDHGTANMTDDGSGLISNWVDRIGGMAVTATTTARPTWGASSFNSSYAGLTFDGVANCFVSTTLTTLPTGSVAGDIYMSVTAAATGTAVILIDYGANATGQQRRVFKAATNRLTIDDGNNAIVDTSGSLSASPVIIGAQFSGTTATGWKNGSATTPATGTISSLATGTTRLRFGSGIAASAASFWNGIVRHIFITTTLSASQRQQLEGWLAWDSNNTSLLPASHPYKSVRP